MVSEKRWYLVSYDIRHPKRWRQAYKKLRGRGEWLQYSLFRCRMTEGEKESLRWELETLLTAEDDLMFVHLCPGCAGRIDHRGNEKDWTPPERFEII
jgi:CRISPR-associated protein Cas2